MRGRIVVVEDEASVREAVVGGLRSEGFVAHGFADASSPETLLALAPDLAILDIGLPSGDGFALARGLRDRREVAILFLTARDAVADRVAGLELGADDYLVKPFALEELLARCRAVLRRVGRLASVLEAGDLLVDEAGGWVAPGRRRADVTATELRLLSYLMRHRGQLLSKDQLLTQVWGYDAYDPNLVEVHVSALRRKLAAPGRARDPHRARDRLPVLAVNGRSLRFRVVLSTVAVLDHRPGRFRRVRHRALPQRA